MEFVSVADKIRKEFIEVPYGESADGQLQQRLLGTSPWARLSLRRESLSDGVKANHTKGSRVSTLQAMGAETRHVILTYYLPTRPPQSRHPRYDSL